MQKQFKALGRLPHGVMNKTEEEHAWSLEMQKRRGEILEYRFAPLRLILADRCTYEPDFLVITREGLVEFHEVKGEYVTDDATVKLKLAARLFPYFTFRRYQRIKKEGWKMLDIPACAP